MAGRKAKPINLHLYDGKKHLGKGEIEARKAAEVNIGNLTFKAPPELRGKKLATKKFKWIVKLYSDAGLMLVSSADIDTISEYCITFQELKETTELRDSFYCNGQCADINDFIKLSNTQNKLRTKLIKYSDLLYLNPVARARTSGKPSTEKPKSKLEEEGFGNL